MPVVTTGMQKSVARLQAAGRNPGSVQSTASRTGPCCSRVAGALTNPAGTDKTISSRRGLQIHYGGEYVESSAARDNGAQAA